MEEPRQRITELTDALQATLGERLLAVYLYGSIPAGGFCEGKSDIDLMAVVSTDITDVDLPDLEAMHSAFAERHPSWRNRIEVGYLSPPVLRTLASVPTGTMAVTSPGEPLHLTAPTDGWVLNWHSVLIDGETLFGPQPLTFGEAVSADAVAAVLRRQIAAWEQEVSQPWIAHSRAYQGYIVLGVCRALYGLETGRSTTKEGAASWAAARFPEWADFIRQALAWNRADLSEPHNTTIRFVSFASGVVDSE
jgi:Aminoglycoside adenylyltransferase, C-terminal domain